MNESRPPSVRRVEDAAATLGLAIHVRRFPEGTRTAPDAARAVGCEVGQIVKSLVFMADERAILALTCGANRADVGKLAALNGASAVRRATAEEARQATGFAIGGTPPWTGNPLVQVFVDETLMAHDEVWAAAGTPDAVFPIAPADLLRLSGGTVAEFAE